MNRTNEGAAQLKQRTLEQVVKSLTESIVWEYDKQGGSHLELASIRAAASAALIQTLPAELKAMGIKL